MAEKDRGEKSLQPVDDGHSLEWLAGTLGALGMVLVFVYTVVNNHLPESFWGIAIVDAIFVIFATAFLVVLNRQLAGEGRRHFLLGSRSLVVFVVMAFAVVAGALAGRASTAGDPAGGGGSSAYARHLRDEVRVLQSAGQLGPTNHTGSRAVYAEKAKELGETYGEVVSDLRRMRVNKRDRAAHRYLVRQLAGVGRAYEHLGQVTSERPASLAQVDAARDEARAAMKRVRSAEEGLERRGYRILFPPR